MDQFLKTISESESYDKATKKFARLFRANIEKRVPACGTLVDVYRFGHYFDPYSRGILLDVKFKNLEDVKLEIKLRWEVTDTNSSNSAVSESEMQVDDTNESDPLEAMIRMREAHQSAAAPDTLSPLELEFLKYEKLPKVKKDVDALKWWMGHKDVLPLMFKIAQELLGIPVSSSKSERIFSTAGRIDTTQRMRLSPATLENLVILSENVHKVRKLANKYSIKKDSRTLDPQRMVLVEVLDVDSGYGNDTEDESESTEEVAQSDCSDDDILDGDC